VLHSFQHSSLDEMPPADIRWQANNSDTAPAVTGPSLQAILEARRSLEAVLVTDENWRALQQLLARENAGEWIDVVESDVLRDHLTTALAAQPAFMAWQFVDAARACIETAHSVANDVEGAACEAGPVKTIDAAFFAVEPEPVVIAPLVNSEPDHARAVPSSQYPVSQLLATRIPTLQVHEKRGQEKQLTAPESTHYLALPTPHPEEPEILRQPTNIITSDLKGQLQARSASPSSDPANTLFQSEAVGIEEAEIEIVIRQPKKQLLDARLPPLPLTNGAQSSTPRKHKAGRTTAVKWIDPNDGADPDYRPVSSALDEAQVSIIATGTKSEAQSRAERRALGIAPDRENQMRRFLSALSGDSLK
jgi:hypothetical protein